MAIQKILWNYDGKGNFIIVYSPKDYKNGLGGRIIYNCGPTYIGNPIGVVKK